MTEKKLSRIETVTMPELGIAVTLKNVGDFLKSRDIPFIFMVDISNEGEPSITHISHIPEEARSCDDPILRRVHSAIAVPEGLAPFMPDRLKAGLAAEGLTEVAELPIDMWKTAVVAGETELGYWEWASNELGRKVSKEVSDKLTNMINSMFGKSV